MQNKKVLDLLEEAAQNLYGEEKGFLATYMVVDEDLVCETVEGGGLAELTYIMARQILCVSATHGIKPWKLWALLTKALRMMIRRHKQGVPIGTFETRRMERD